MDDARALVGLLDRLAHVRRMDASRTRHTSRAGPGSAQEPSPVRVGGAAHASGLPLARIRAGGAAHDAAGRSLDVRLDSCVRCTFALVSEFRDAFKSNADPHWLGILLQAIRQDAAYTFDAAAKVRRETAEFSSDKARCLADLAQVHQALRSSSPPTAHDLAHAMDALIVQLIRVQTGSARDGWSDAWVSRLER